MPYGRGRTARTNRRKLRAKLKEIQGKRAELERRDLNAEARAEEDAALVKEAREIFQEFRERTRSLERAALERLRGVTPSAKRRLAIFQNPQRYAAMVSALESIPDEELPAFAELAKEKQDHAAFAALTRTVTERDPTSEVTETVTRLASEGDPEFAESIAEAVVVRQELAGMALDAAEALEDEGLSREALSLGHGAARIELEGRSVTYDDAELDRLYKGLNLDRALESVSWPEPEGGTVDPRAYAHQTA